MDAKDEVCVKVCVQVCILVQDSSISMSMHVRSRHLEQVAGNFNEAD